MQIESQKVGFLEALGRLLGDLEEGKMIMFFRGAKIDFDMEK